MSYYGSWNIDDALTFVVNTQRFDTGAATDADSVPTYRVYEDETGTPLLTGSMALLDSANTAGFYSEQITLSAANGFEAGKCYSIYITATVNSVAGAMNHNFQVLAKVNTTHIAGSAVSTSTAQIGVNVVNFGGAAGTFASGRPEVNTTHIAGSAVSTSSAQIGVNVVNAGATAWNSGAIKTTTFTAGAIDAAAIAADAIGASELAADAVTEIQSGLSTLTQANVRSAVGLASANLDTQLAGIQADTDDIQTRIPAALVSGRIDASVGAMAADTVTASAIAADAIGASELAAGAANEIADALLDRSAGVETGLTVRQAFRLFAAALLGKASGLATATAVYRDTGDSKDRITATVDSDGNRTAVTLDAT